MDMVWFLSTCIFCFVELQVTLFEHDNEVARKLTSMLTKIRKNHHSNYQLCHIVRQDEQPRETSLLLSNLVEDQTAGTFSYRDWMLQIFLQTQQISWSYNRKKNKKAKDHIFFLVYTGIVFSKFCPSKYLIIVYFLGFKVMPASDILNN